MKTMLPHHIALKVQDLVLCEKFYAEVLGLSVIARNNYEDGTLRSIWFDCGGTILMLEKMQPATTSSAGKKKAHPNEEDAPGWHLFALRIDVNARDEWKERLQKANASIYNESDYSVYFTDPEGNRLALSHYPEPFIATV